MNALTETQPSNCSFPDEVTRRAALNYAPQRFPGTEQDYPIQQPQKGQMPVELGYNSNAVQDALRRYPVGPVIILMNRVTRYECDHLLKNRPDVHVVEYTD